MLCEQRLRKLLHRFDALLRARGVDVNAPYVAKEKFSRTKESGERVRKSFRWNDDVFVWGIGTKEDDDVAPHFVYCQVKQGDVEEFLLIRFAEHDGPFQFAHQRGESPRTYGATESEDDVFGRVSAIVSMFFAVSSPFPECQPMRSNVPEEVF
jgi:hypothetical protein